MQVNVRFLDNLRLEASFDDYTIISDQPVRYKGDATAPGPYDYFLASSAMCAAYFVKLYCSTRGIPTEDIQVSQQNTVDPDNRYQQDFHLLIDLPESISEKDRKGILASMERCTVKRVIQNQPGFIIKARSNTQDRPSLDYTQFRPEDYRTKIPGKDATLEETIANMTALLSDLGIEIEIASWRNPIPHVWSVHIRDAESPMCYTNGKGTTKDAALCSALGEFLERISSNYFYADYFLGQEFSEASFVHYPEEKWFEISHSNPDAIPAGLLDESLLAFYNPESELEATHLIDTNSGNSERGICALPFKRQSDGKDLYFPVSIIGNLYVSNGMSAGNTIAEARVQALSEIFERAIKNRIITEEICLPDIPQTVLTQYPQVLEAIESLREKGYPIIVKDASLGGLYPVLCVTLMNSKNGGVFASFGSHPSFEVALERSLTELLQGRSFEGLNDTAPPTFNSLAISEPNNLVDHFIDSTGVISWKFFGQKPNYEFKHWNFTGSTQEEFDHLMGVFSKIEKEVYIADYQHLGCSACRIIVPDFSEIYSVEDLVWDNNNRALFFREDILNIHTLNNEDLKALAERIVESELDDFMPVSELIGIAFDESDAWSRLTLGELKGLIFLSLRDFEEARNQVELFATFNDSTPQRRKFYQLLGVLLDIELEDELTQEEYKSSLINMYGAQLYQQAIDSIEGREHFHGLSKTDLNLKNLAKHLALIESYRKLHSKRREYSARSTS